MAETIQSEGKTNDKALLQALAIEISECAGVTDMLSAHVVGCSLPEGRMESHLIYTLNVLTRRLNNIASNAEEGSQHD